MHERPLGTTGPGSVTPDRRITDLILETMTAAPAGRPGRNAADPFRVAAATTQSLGRSTPLIMGTVVHAVPHLNWYKVQTLEAGFLGCCLLRQTSALPLGVHAGSVVPANSCVLVYKSPHLDYGVILGVLPPLVQTNATLRPDQLVQGGRSGLYVEAAHQQPIRGTVRGGGVLDFSCGSPLDATSLDWSLITETGSAFLLDPFQAYLRVNEHCGVFFNLFDSYARLIGHALDVMSAVHEASYRNDEGENYAFCGHSVYPWEAAGNFAPGGAADHDEYAAADVQAGDPVAPYDLPRERQDTRPFHRRRDYQAYLGQGGLRSLCAPPGDSGFNSRGDATGALPAPGLFAESIGLDGGYLLRSAKSITLVKRCSVPVPRTLQEPENPLGDAAGGAYRFSGHFGDGPEHQVGDLRLGDNPSGATTVLGLQTFLAHACNWKALHPFHYHAGDFDVPQEEGAVAEVPDFAELSTSNRLSDPVPFRLRIDHRYGQVNYYRRESFLHMADDGSVIIGCGNGARIAMVNGKLRVEAPGDIELVAGGRVVTLGHDLVMQAAASVDVAALGGDVRVAADFNLQLCGFGVLVESRNPERAYDYRNRVGEEVGSSGIVLRSASDLVLLGEDLYLRSSASGESSGGGITLDAARRTGSLRVEAADVEMMTESGMVLGHGGADQDPTHAHVFRASHSVLPSLTYAAGGLRVSGGDLTADGGVSALGDVTAGGRIADSQGGMVSRLPDAARQRLREAAQNDASFLASELEDSAGVAAAVAADWLAEGRPGSPDLLRDMHFSFRDDDEGRQYGTADLAFLEPRWQQMARLAGAAQGQVWPDGSVPYQGRTLYPWPGRRAWTTAGAFLRGGTPTLYDPATGSAVTRTAAAYGDAAHAAPVGVTMREGLRTIL